MNFEVTRASSKKEVGPSERQESAAPIEVLPRSPLVVVLWEGHEAQVAAPIFGSITIGRAPTCDLVVDHRSVSRLHATVHVVDGRFSIEDHGSSNGTQVQGERIAPGDRVAVTFGDVVEIGATILTLQEGAFDFSSSEDSAYSVSGERETMPGRDAEGPVTWRGQ